MTGLVRIISMSKPNVGMISRLTVLAFCSKETKSRHVAKKSPRIFPWRTIKDPISPLHSACFFFHRLSKTTPFFPIRFVFFLSSITMNGFSDLNSSERYTLVLRSSFHLTIHTISVMYMHDLQDHWNSHANNHC